MLWFKWQLEARSGTVSSVSSFCTFCCYCSVTQSCPTLCDLHGLQHARPPCPSSAPGACSDSCPLSQWCHPTISSSVIPFSSCLQSFPASGSVLMSWLLASGGQNIGGSASASVLPVNIQDWFPLELAGLILAFFMGLVWGTCVLLVSILKITKRRILLT